MHMLLMIGVIIAAPVEVRREFPESLRRVMESRKARTSEIEWTITYLQGHDAGLVERHITRTAGNTVWQVNLGDENGYHRLTFQSSPADDSEEALRQAANPRELDAGPQHALVYDGDVWHIDHHRDDRPHLVGHVTPDKEASAFRPFDFTAAGIGPWYDGHTGVLGGDPQLFEGSEAATYTVSTNGDIQTITGEFNGKSIQWQINRRRGGAPVYAALYVGDKARYTACTDLAQSEDGRWFPHSIRYYVNDDQDPYKIIEIQKASFDRADHMRDFTPNDIGVLFGTQLFGHGGRPHRWDGTRLITGEEYDELIYIDGMRPDPYVVEKLAEGMGMTVEEYLAQMDKTMEQWRARYVKEHGETPWLVKKSDEPDPWDLYVAEFIKKHNLDEPRIKRANALLERAKKLRDYQRRKNRSAVEKARRAGEAEKLARYDEITERIFQKVLVAGLEKLVPATPAAAPDKDT